MAEIPVCRKDDFGSGCRIVASGGVEIGVYRHKDGYVAYRNLCPHQGGPVCEGVIIPRVVTVLDQDQSFRRSAFDMDEMHFVCPWHGWEYRIATGECVGDSRIRLKSYPVVEREGMLYVAA